MRHSCLCIAKCHICSIADYALLTHKNFVLGNSFLSSKWDSVSKAIVFRAKHYNYSITINLCLYWNNRHILAQSSFDHPSFILRSSFVHPSIEWRKVINGSAEDKEWNKHPINHGIKIHKLRKNNPYFTEFSRNPLLFNKLFASLHPRNQSI